MFIKTITVESEVDICSEDISDDDILEIAEQRGLSFGRDEDDINAMFDAFKLGKDADAMVIAKRMCQDITGRVLP
jgi:hypothetical protein